MTKYLFDNAHDSAIDRFTALEQRYDPVTTARLDEIGTPWGGRCLEIGGGGGSIARWLAERVGPDGSVLVTDIDTSRIDVAGCPWPNVEVRSHDIVHDALPEGEFDLVHARLVLIHIPERQAVLRRILRALRPGGCLVLDEFDCTWSHVLAAPDTGAAALVDKIVDAVHRVLERGGMDLAWGRNAYGAMAAAGFGDLGVRGFCEAWHGGSVGAQLHRTNVRQVEDRIVEYGLADRSEIEAFQRLALDPRLAVASYLMLSTWGRRPS